MLKPANDPDLKAEALKLVPECARLKDQIREYVAERCPVCDRDVTDLENRDRLADPLYCEYGGCGRTVDGYGRVHEAMPRCPFKPAYN